jgi:hypothetical protein
MKHEIDLGRDGDPSDTPASVWIILENGTFHIEAECYKEAWYDLDAENTQKLFNALGINSEDTSEIETILKQNFMQSPGFQNFQVLDKFRDICKENDIKYTYNSWCDFS